MKIIVINGRPRAGKDTFVEFCQKHCMWCLNISTVDFVKDVARYCGWNGEKTPENRKFLSDLKALLTEWDDVPFRKVGEAIIAFGSEMKIYDFDPDKDGIVFIHCREPEQIDRFKKELGAQALLISREEDEDDDDEMLSNKSDANVYNYKYDYYISNEGTLQDLEDVAVRFLDGMGIKNLK